jgi:hypothetical protein
MKGFRLLKPFDWGVIGAALSITVFSAVFVYAGGYGGQGQLLVKGTGEQWVFPLDGTEIIKISGPLGDTVVELRDAAARIITSPCENQTCVAQGAIRFHGQWTACLPNRVLISINGKTNGGRNNELDGAVW